MIENLNNKRDFFVSFNKADRAWAAWIAWQLEEKGYSVFFQDWDFKGNFVLEMDKVHAQSRRTIAVLSPDYLASRFTAPEWAARFAQDATSEHDLLLPVRVRPCDLKGLLAPIIYVDLIGSSEDEARRKLLQRVEGIRLKPAEPPLFPGQASHDVIPERPAFPMAVPTGETATGRDLHPSRNRAVPTTWLAAALTALVLVIAIGLVIFLQGNVTVSTTGDGVAAGRDATGITIIKGGTKQ